MIQKDKISKFVEEVFDLYGIIKLGYFYEIDEDDMEKYTIPLFSPFEDENDTLERISIATGLTKEEIINTDIVAAKKYMRKYKFFELYEEYSNKLAWEYRYLDKPSTEQILFDALFNGDCSYSVKERYDYKSVKDRLIKLIKEIDEVVPGTCHKDAEITQLRIRTEVMISFPQVTEMVESFIEMVKTVECIFFKGLEEELSSEEVHEYNFLVTWLSACDIVMPNTLLTYDNLCLYRSVYKEEGYRDFYSYVNIKSWFMGTAPWRCKEFFDDMAVVQRFINIFPYAKAKMREFAMEVSNFYCEFVWSDAKHITFSDWEEELLSDFNRVIGEEDTPIEERALECTQMYVPKTADEMFDWRLSVERLKKAASSVAIGGLKVPGREWEYSPNDGIRRIQKRVALKSGVTNNE